MPTERYKRMPEEYEPKKLLASTETPLTEERVREIVREELAAYEKRQQQTRGWRPTMETKSSPPRPRVDEKLIGGD